MSSKHLQNSSNVIKRSLCGFWRYGEARIPTSCDCHSGAVAGQGRSQTFQYDDWWPVLLMRLSRTVFGDQHAPPVWDISVMLSKGSDSSTEGSSHRNLNTGLFAWSPQPDARLSVVVYCFCKAINPTFLFPNISFFFFREKLFIHCHFPTLTERCEHVTCMQISTLICWMSSC